MKKNNNHKFSHLFIISGPSGVGKASIINFLLKNTNLKKVVNYTTRKPRPFEINNSDYNFISKEKFMKLKRKGEIFESEQVYGNHFYGSPKLLFDESASNRLIELDPKGQRRYKNFYPEDITTIFIIASNINSIKERIKKRYPEKNLAVRLATAVKQLKYAYEYDYIVVNDILKKACQEVQAVIIAAQLKKQFNSVISLIRKINKNICKN